MIGEPMNFVHLTHIGSGEMGAGDGLAMVTKEWELWPGTVPHFESEPGGITEYLKGSTRLGF